MKTKLIMGVCPKCQSEVAIASDGTCADHTVCNMEGMPQCEGSINTDPEVTFSVEI